MKFNTRSIAFKIWMYFCIFAAMFMILLWLLLTVFLNKFYEGMKKNAIGEVVDTLVDKYGEDDFEETANRLAFENSLLVLVTDEERNIYFASDEHGTDKFNVEPYKEGSEGEQSDKKPFEEPPQEIPIDELPIEGDKPVPIEFGFVPMLPKDFPEFLDMLKESSTGRINYTFIREPNLGQTLVFGARMGDEILFVSSPLAPVNVTVGIIRTQLFYVMILAIIICSVIALFLARKLSKPIVNITETAEELAKGNYDIQFDKGYYEEIDNLSDTLNYTTKELSKVEGLRRELIANISHDFRTPLTMIKAYAELIRDISGDKKEKREAHIGIIIEEADRLSLLVNDILELSAIQQTEGDISRIVNVNLSAVLGRVLTRFKLLEEHYGYTIQTDIDHDIYVLADERKMEQVFYNLIGNGINYIGDDKKLMVSLKYLDDNVRFEVSDRGAGIEEDELPLIWERYYKSKTHKRSVISTGLGLSIVKGILEMHHAAFGVNSRVGFGSTFWFELEK